MKKSLILAIVAAAFMASSAFAEIDLSKYNVEEFGDYNYPTPNSKASFIGPNPYQGEDVSSHSYWLLQGFDLTKYDPEYDPGMSDIVDNEIIKINNFSQLRDTDGKYFVVGHSQGGPRSLAYATKLKEQGTAEQYKQLKGVITISGIDRGIKALDGGFGQLKSKLSSDVDIACQGVYGVYTALPITSIIAIIGANLFGYSFVGDMVSYGSYSTLTDNQRQTVILDALKTISKKSDCDGLYKYFSRAWKGCKEEEDQQLYDMMPDSDFINSYVCQQTTAKIAKVQTGTTKKYTYTWKKIPFLNIRYYTVSEVDVPLYTTYSTSTPTSVQFDSKMPVGYIVGTDSSTLGLAGNAPDVHADEGYATDTSEGAKTAKSVMNGLGTAMEVFKGINIAKALLTKDATTGASYASSASKCKNAAYFFKNIEDYINDVKGSSENDGFVAVESQYIPKTAHSKILAVSEKEDNYISVKQNHQYTEPVYYGSPADDIDEKIPMHWDFSKGARAGTDDCYINTNNIVMKMIDMADSYQ